MDLDPDTARERAIERDRLEIEVALPTDAAAHGESEVTGYGASAHWTHHPEDRPAPTAGPQRQLATYDLPDGTTRALLAQRINGRVALSDLPLDGHGRVYLVERHVRSQAELDGLVTAYVAHSLKRGMPAVIATTEAEAGR